MSVVRGCRAASICSNNVLKENWVKKTIPDRTFVEYLRLLSCLFFINYTARYLISYLSCLYISYGCRTTVYLFKYRICTERGSCPCLGLSPTHCNVCLATPPSSRLRIHSNSLSLSPSHLPKITFTQFTMPQFLEVHERMKLWIAYLYNFFSFILV